VALTVTGCSDGGGVSKAGGPEPVSLRLANAYATLQYEPAVAAFVDQAEHRAGGLLHIEVTSTVGDFQPDAEQRIVERVASGEFDLACVGTRVFDTLGVQAFAALTAPMLVDSFPLEAAVLASDLPSRMLPALDGANGGTLVV
jgi:hypothetical protein